MFRGTLQVAQSWLYRLYLCIEHGKRKSLGESIVINDTEIRELDVGEAYTYLGVDESVGIDGELNKEKVKME